jgi:hypothetical protein
MEETLIVHSEIHMSTEINADFSVSKWAVDIVTIEL